MNVQIVSFLTACLLSTVYSEGSVEFCYNSPKCGPDTWSTISPKSCNGSRQSPINIVTSEVTVDSNLTAFRYTGFQDSANVLQIINSGKSVVITIDDYSVSVSGGGLDGQYNTSQLHFHWGNGSSVKGSEHTVDGKQYAMEMHIVNKGNRAADDQKALAVLAFFIEATNDSGTSEIWKNLTSFLSQISNRAGETLDIRNQLSLVSLLQGVDLTKYYRYLGSLTTPTCDETVVWTIFKDPIKVSKDLIDLFSNTVHTSTLSDPFITNNFRPVQSLNGRKVSTSSATTSLTSKPYHILSISALLLYSVLLPCW